MYCLILWPLLSTLAGVSDMVKETWKYAAAEICDMLNRVKDHAGDTKALETKINKMVASMNQQSDVINQLNKKIQELEEVHSGRWSVQLWRVGYGNVRDGGGGGNYQI